MSEAKNGASSPDSPPFSFQKEGLSSSKAFMAGLFALCCDFDDLEKKAMSAIEKGPAASEGQYNLNKNNSPQGSQAARSGEGAADAE